ncbi:MAG: hypothetical protein PF961_08430 [Planctomycetota bacterium]|jgi:hypothetical protein|nr:hypothetical protein [Planctomycetota bacterium]
MKDVNSSGTRRQPGSIGAGNRRTAKVLGFIAMALGFTMLAAAVGAPVAMPQRIALGILGLGGAYWGFRFISLGQSSD